MQLGKLESVVIFADDIDRAATACQELFGGAVDKSQNTFYRIMLSDLMIGIHPADLKTPPNTVVPYFEVTDLAQDLANAGSSGFELLRGPAVTSDGRIAQIINASGLRIGLIEK